MNQLVPIFICAIMPIAVVLISAMIKMNDQNKRAKVLMKAIEANNSIDTEKLADTLRAPRKSALEILNLRLLRGCMFSFIGLALCIVGFVNLAQPGVSFDSDPVTVPLLFGGASLAVGLSYLVVYFVTRKQLPDNKD